MPQPRRFSRRAGMGAALAAFVLPATAWAHAILDHSEPPARGKVPAGRIPFRLYFNSRIDGNRSMLTLMQQGHERVRVPIDPQDSPQLLTTTIELPPGAYVLRWQVLAVDGHITRGDLPFTATAP